MKISSSERFHRLVVFQQFVLEGYGKLICNNRLYSIEEHDYINLSSYFNS